MPLFRPLLAALVLATVPAPRLVAQFVDQEDSRPVIPTHWGGWIGETFTPTATNVSGAGVLARTTMVAFPGVETHLTLSVELWTAPLYDPTAERLAAGTETFAGHAASGYLDAFWTPVAVVPGTSYFVRYSQFNPEGTRMEVWLDPTQLAGSYPGGTLNGNLSDYDLVFREFYTPNSQVVPTPEPATLALVAIGLLGVVGVARRRTRTSAAL